MKGTGLSCLVQRLLLWARRPCISGSKQRALWGTEHLWFSCEQRDLGQLACISGTWGS